jgi:hypothetical protein
MLPEELQDPHEAPRAAHRAVTSFQLAAELDEAGGELPIAEDGRVVQRAGLVPQGCQVVNRVEDHLALPETSRVRRHDLAARGDRDPVDVALDCDLLEREGARGAVTAAVEGDGLILVDRDRRADHAGIEPVPGYRRGRGEVLGQAILDRERPEERLHDPLAFGLAAIAKDFVQFTEVGRPGHRRGESLLHGLDRPFGVGLLIAATGHAEARLEDVVTGQRRVAGMTSALAAQEDQRRDGPRVIPPNFLGDGAEELEGGDHPLEDRFGALERRRQHEGGVGVGPGRHQERHESASVGEVDVDVPEVGLEAPARPVPQRKERLLISTLFPEEMALDLGIAALVAAFVAEATIDLGGGVALLRRGSAVVDEDLVDEGLEGAELGSGPVPGQGLGMGVGMHEGMPDGPARVSELAGDLPDGQAIAMSPPNRAIVVHGHPVLALRVGETFSEGTFTVPKGAGVGPAYALILPPGGSRLRAHFHTTADPVPARPMHDAFRYSPANHPGVHQRPLKGRNG